MRPRTVHAQDEAGRTGYSAPCTAEAWRAPAAAGRNRHHHGQGVPDQGRQVALNTGDQHGPSFVEIPPDDEPRHDQAAHEDGPRPGCGGSGGLAEDAGQVPGPAERERLPVTRRSSRCSSRPCRKWRRTRRRSGAPTRPHLPVHEGAAGTTCRRRRRLESYRPRTRRTR